MNGAEDMKAQVIAAATHLLGVFGQDRVEDYFACFTPDATFIFHGLNYRLASIADYRAAWAGWVSDLDLHILGAWSQNQTVDFIAPGVALFTHSVQVKASTKAGIEHRRERETVVFVRQADGKWLGVHEHLSKDPNA
jgi:ketosteroid isomerase-like protein